jgi:hypothetical protein
MIPMKMSHRPSACWIAHSELGKPAAIEVKISSDMPLPMPRSVISSASHMIRPVPAVRVSTMMTMVGHRVVGEDLGALRAEDGARVAGEGDERRGLQDRQTDGEIARVLRHLGLPGLTLLLEGLKARNDDREQLNDDARSDIGHDPEREDRQLQQARHR